MQHARCDSQPVASTARTKSDGALAQRAALHGCDAVLPRQLYPSAAFDFDLRLAVGLLQEEIDALDIPWPEQVAAAVGDNGPALPVVTHDAWLGAFIAGRLAGLRETFGHDGVRADHWRQAFWDRYLEMTCRHAEIDGVRRALAQGADPRADGLWRS